MLAVIKWGVVIEGVVLLIEEGRGGGVILYVLKECWVKTMVRIRIKTRRERGRITH